MRFAIWAGTASRRQTRRLASDGRRCSRSYIEAGAQSATKCAEGWRIRTPSLHEMSGPTKITCARGPDGWGGFSVKTGRIRTATTLGGQGSNFNTGSAMAHDAEHLVPNVGTGFVPARLTAPPVLLNPFAATEPSSYIWAGRRPGRCPRWTGSGPRFCQTAGCRPPGTRRRRPRAPVGWARWGRRG